jgi:hypothetical protein
MEESVEPKAKVAEEEMYSKEAEVKETPVKLDPHGYPLRPQPSDDPKGLNFSF